MSESLAYITAARTAGIDRNEEIISLSAYVYKHTVGWSGSGVYSEAGGVSFDSHSQVLTVGPVKMCVKQGDITREKADAIVNSTNEHLDMTSGRYRFYLVVTN